MNKNRSLRAMHRIGVIAGTAGMAAGLIAGIAAPASAGTITGTCDQWHQYDAATRKCRAAWTETAPYTYTHVGSWNARYITDLTKGPVLPTSLPTDAISRGYYALSQPYFELINPNWDYYVRWDSVGTRNAPPAGWYDSGTGYARNMTSVVDPITEVENTSTEQAAINAVLSATTSTQATSLLAAAQAAYNGLRLQISKDALAASMTAANAKPGQLKAAEDAAVAAARAAAVAEAKAAIADVMAATTSSAAQAKLTIAERKASALETPDLAPLMDSLAKASQHVSDLAAEELAQASEATKRAAAQDAIAEVMAATTYATASSRLATAQGTFSVLNATSKAALQASMTGAEQHAAGLAEAEAEADRKQLAVQALNAVASATTSAQATSLLSIAKDKVAALNAANQSALAAQITTAEQHVVALAAAELATMNEAQRKQAASAAIADVTTSKSYADAAAALAKAKGMFEALDSANKAALADALADAEQRVTALKATDDAARAAMRAASSGASVTSAASGGGVGSNRATASPATKVNALLSEIDALPVASSSVQRAVIASAELNALAKANPLVMTPELRTRIEVANRKVAEILGLEEVPAGASVVSKVIVGRGETARTDKAHQNAIRTALAAVNDAILVTVSADKDWPASQRKAYQTMVKSLAVQAGVDPNNVKIAKPRPTETVTVYTLNP